MGEKPGDAGGFPGNLRPEYFPGDIGFDPLGLKPESYEDFAEMSTKELQQGRLAMLAVAGFIAQELVNGKGILENFGLYIYIYPTFFLTSPSLITYTPPRREANYTRERKNKFSFVYTIRVAILGTY